MQRKGLNAPPWLVSADDVIQALSRGHLCRAKRSEGDVGKEVQTYRKFHFLAFDYISPHYYLGNVLYLSNSRKISENFIKNKNKRGPASLYQNI